MRCFLCKKGIQPGDLSVQHKAPIEGRLRTTNSHKSCFDEAKRKGYTRPRLRVAAHGEKANQGSKT